MNPRLVLTPEHVQIRLQPAGLGSRFLAFMLDWLAAAAISGVLATLLMAMLPLGGVGYLLWATSSFLVGWGYHVYFETRHEGRSPGKRVLRLRVVDGRGLPLGVAQSFVRNVVRALDMAPLLYGVGGLSCLLDRHRRRLGDLAADTVVVAEARAFEPDPSAALAPEYNSLRTPRVLRMARRRLSLDDREFLATLVRRAPALDDAARFDIMEEAGRLYRERLELADLPLSGEQVVRGLAAVLFAEAAAGRGGRARAGLPRAAAAGALAAACLLPACGGSPAASSPPPPPAPAHTIRSVTDGDTVGIAPPLNGSGTVRLLNIDAPELRGDTQEPWAARARDELRALLPPGTGVSVLTDREVLDGFGRVLGRLVRADGLDVNGELLRRGAAVLYVIWPNVAGFEEYRAAQVDAQRGRRGVWDPSAPLRELPFEYRRRTTSGRFTRPAGDSLVRFYVDPESYGLVHVNNRVFFADEPAAQAAGYRSCPRDGGGAYNPTCFAPGH